MYTQLIIFIPLSSFLVPPELLPWIVLQCGPYLDCIRFVIQTLLFSCHYNVSYNLVAQTTSYSSGERFLNDCIPCYVSVVNTRRSQMRISQFYVTDITLGFISSIRFPPDLVILVLHFSEDYLSWLCFQVTQTRQFIFDLSIFLSNCLKMKV